MSLLSLILWAVMSGSTVLEYGKQPLDEWLADKVSTQHIHHTGYSSGDQRQLMVQKAYEIWGIELVTLIECENWSWLPTKQSDVVKNWIREPSFWLCQISRKYHPEIVNDTRFWNDWEWQINKCEELRKWGTKFYAPQRKINWVECSKYVLDRFIITDVIH